MTGWRKRQVMEMALEALEPLVRRAAPWGELDWLNGCKAITVIKEALAQPEHGWTPERIAGMARLKEAQDKKLAQPEQPKVRTGNCLRVGVCASEGHKIAPQRPWIGLTLEELSEIYNQTGWDTVNGWGYERAIEAKLKEKNFD